MLQIRDVRDSIASVHHNNKTIGVITTQYQLNDLRLQVKENQLEGVYLCYDDGEICHRIEISPSGSLSKWPKGFFDLLERQLAQLVFDKK